jgi:amino acid adenylation domain-containing protein
MDLLLQPLPHPVLPPVIDLVRAAAAAGPKRIAVVSGYQELSYKEFLARVEGVAASIASKGINQHQVVALLAEKSIDSIVAFAGLFAGGYVAVPIDAALPPARKRRMLELGQVEAVLTALDSNDMTGMPTSITIIDSRSFVGPPKTMTLIAPDDRAYIFFTSGSTGEPKPIVGKQDSVTHFVEWEISELQITERDRVAQITSFSFDAILRDVFVPLAAGARILLPPHAFTTARHQVEWLAAERASIVHTTPSIAAIWAREAAGLELPHLRFLCLSGEPLTAETVEAVRSAFATSQAEIVNFYGPSETTMIKSFFRVPTPPLRGIQPLGRPLPQTHLLVMNGDRICLPGESGEIVIRTSFGTLGYLDADEDDRFISNPYRDDPDDKLFRTRDLGSLGTDGLLRIEGRMDHEVNIHGVRVHPAEVEAAIAQHPDVHAVCVIAIRATFEEAPVLMAHVVPAAVGITADALRLFLLDRLLPAMIPARISFHSSLPLLPNGKVDRVALAVTNQPARADEPASTTTEEELLAIWRDLLDQQDIYPLDDFFELGGHSLLAIVLIARIEAAFGVEVPLRALFEHPTVRSLASLVDVLSSATNRDGTATGTVTMRQGDGQPVFFVHAAGASPLAFREVAQQLEGHGAYGMELSESEGDVAIETIAGRCVQSIARVQATGPYAFCGHSLGSVVAFEMALQLERAGEQVSFIGIVDSHAPASKGWVYDEMGLEAEVRRHLERSGSGIELSPAERLSVERTFYALHAAASRYVPSGRLLAPVTLFVAADEASARAPDLGWRETGVIAETQSLPGDHFTILEGRGAEQLAATIKSKLEQPTRAAARRRLARIENEIVREHFRRQAEQCAQGSSSLYTRICRLCAEDNFVTELGRGRDWDFPLRFLAAVNWLRIQGKAPDLEAAYTSKGDPWPAFRDVVITRTDEVVNFVDRQSVQTNEVQRCWALLPAFLVATRGINDRPLDVIELGASAGLNLQWDSFGYAYGTSAVWGPPGARLALSGRAKPMPRDDLFDRNFALRRRLGIDLAPIDPHTTEGRLILESFVWPDKPERAHRLTAAIELARAARPEILRGDYVELLPSVLANRDPEAFTLVFDSASTNYLPAEQLALLRAALADECAQGSFGWVAMSEPAEGWQRGFALEVHAASVDDVVAHIDFHGEWIEWLHESTSGTGAPTD